MPVKAPGTHRVTVLRSFCNRLTQELHGEAAPLHPTRREGLTAETVSLAGLSSKALTLLLQGRHREDTKEFKVRRKDRRHVRAFLGMTRSEKHQVLLRDEVWVYRPQDCKEDLPKPTYIPI